MNKMKLLNNDKWNDTSISLTGQIIIRRAENALRIIYPLQNISQHSKPLNILSSRTYCFGTHPFVWPNSTLNQSNFIHLGSTELLLSRSRHSGRNKKSQMYPTFTSSISVWIRYSNSINYQTVQASKN